jgi:hypothetical protein
MNTRDRREYNRQWYLAHRDEQLEQRRQYEQDNRAARNAYRNGFRKSLRDLINEQKQGKACVRCGITDPRVLDFHHRDPEQKLSSLSDLWKRNPGKQAVIDEIAKCELLCANCHRILHWEERENRVAPQPQPLVPGVKQADGVRASALWGKYRP